MRLPSPQSEAINDGERRLSHDLVIEHRGRRYTIRAGFVSDGASIPRLLWRVVGHPWQGRLEPAAWLHDACYRSHLVPRATADLLLRELAVRNGVARPKAWTIWTAVRTCGWGPWAAVGRRHFQARYLWIERT